MEWFYVLFILTAGIYCFVLLQPNRIRHRLAFCFAWITLATSLTITPVFTVMQMFGDTDIGLIQLSVFRELLIGISLLFFLYAMLPGQPGDPT